MIEYLQEIWNSAPIWVWKRILTALGIIIILVSINSLAKSKYPKHK